MTTLDSPPRLLPSAPPRRRFRLWWLLPLLPALVLLQIAQATWKGIDVNAGPFHGLDLRARNLSGQEWLLDRAASGESHYWVDGLSVGDTVKTWTDVGQDGHFGIATRIDSIVSPGPVRLVEATATSDSEDTSYPPNGSPIGNTTQLPITLRPGDSVPLGLTWSLTSCHPPGAEPATFSVQSVDVHETVLGVHRTRPLPLGYTLNLVEPECPTGR